MAAPSKAIAPAEWQWPEDVVAFAEANQVRTCLEPLLEATRQLFPTANSLHIYLEADPELRDERYIVFEVNVPDVPPPRSLEPREKWIHEMAQLCHGLLINPFHLRLTLRS
jgi:hypothetical protein